MMMVEAAAAVALAAAAAALAATMVAKAAAADLAAAAADVSPRKGLNEGALIAEVAIFCATAPPKVVEKNRAGKGKRIIKFLDKKTTQKNRNPLFV